MRNLVVLRFRSDGTTSSLGGQIRVWGETSRKREAHSMPTTAGGEASRHSLVVGRAPPVKGSVSFSDIHYYK